MKETRTELIQFRCYTWEKELIEKLSDGKVSNVREILVSQAKAIYKDNNKISRFNKHVNDIDIELSKIKEKVSDLELQRESYIKMLEKEMNGDE